MVVFCSLQWEVEAKIQIPKSQVPSLTTVGFQAGDQYNERYPNSEDLRPCCWVDWINTTSQWNYWIFKHSTYSNDIYIIFTVLVSQKNPHQPSIHRVFDIFWIQKWKGLLEPFQSKTPPIFLSPSNPPDRSNSRPIPASWIDLLILSWKRRHFFRCFKAAKPTKSTQDLQSAPITKTYIYISFNTIT